MQSGLHDVHHDAMNGLTPMSNFIIPDWPAPANVKSLMTTRLGGVSAGNFASNNLGLHVGDDEQQVAANRSRLRELLPGEPKWLSQVHGSAAVAAHQMHGVVQADGAWTNQPGIVCTVLVADCLPVLLCDRAGTVVGCAHAGWRGLAEGVIERTLEAMQKPGSEVIAWLGPAIGAEEFEVGQDVYDAFVERDSAASVAFRHRPNGKYLADIYALARLRLQTAGVVAAYGGGCCTVTDKQRFFSFRRDKTTGRMAALIWMDSVSHQA